MSAVDAETRFDRGPIIGSEDSAPSAGECERLIPAEVAIIQSSGKAVGILQTIILHVAFSG